MLRLLKFFWKDPVWSKIIAFGIIGVLSMVAARFIITWSTVWLLFLGIWDFICASTPLPNWAFCVAVIIVILIYYGILKLKTNQNGVVCCTICSNKINDKTVEYVSDAIKKCRYLIELHDNMYEREFRSTVEYSMLRPFVSDNFKKRVESGHINIAIGHGRGCGGEQFKVSLLDELVRIEQEYSIIPTPKTYKT